jgi:SAM-dependent methyltransferase
VDPAVAALLRCPRCRGALEAGARCSACALEFPSVGGIPCVLADPGATLSQWRFRLHEAVTSIDDSRERILAELAGESMREPTRRRLTRLRDALAVHRERILAIMHEAGIDPAARTVPEGPSVPGEASITSYYHQLHRDWGWRDDETVENRAALAAVSAMIGDRPLGRMLVLGAGAARLARDVHAAHCGSFTIALDINPLPLVVAARVLAGERVPMIEFPLSPRGLEQVAVDRELMTDAPPVRGFHPMFADGLDPPFPDCTFDTVLTPWFIDQVPPDMAALFPAIHRVLKPGGTWLNHGPLVYHPNHTLLVHRYRADEVLELVAASGFAIEGHAYDRLLYMQSPACAQGRTEMVLSFRARRIERVQHAVREPPAWLREHTLPVPLLAGLERYVAPHPLFAAVAALVDGRRSIADIAAVLVAKHGLPEAAAAGGVQACLAEIWRALDP